MLLDAAPLLLQAGLPFLQAGLPFLQAGLPFLQAGPAFLQAAHASDLPGGYGTALLQTLLALAAVCILAWTVLRWSSGRGLSGLGGGRIEILERAHLEPRRTLYLVRIGARTFLVGAGESGPPALIAEIAASELPDAKPGTTFADVLRRVRPVEAGKREPEKTDDA